jgi:hypothetical protein
MALSEDEMKPTYKPQSSREREDYKKFLEEDEKQQAELSERIAAPMKLKALEQEMNQNTRKLQQAKRQQALGYEEQPHVSPELVGITMSIEEANAFNGREAQAFMRENPEYYPTEENKSVLLGYFTNRGINIVDRKMLKSAFISLRRDGLFEEPAPAPVPISKPVPEPVQESFDNIPRLPLGHQQPIAYMREPDGSQEGRDLVTGERRRYSSYEIELLSAEDYRRAFNVPTPTLSKGSFLKR